MANSEGSFQAKSYCTKYKAGWLAGPVQEREITVQFAEQARMALELYKLARLTPPNSMLGRKLHGYAPTPVPRRAQPLG